MLRLQEQDLKFVEGFAKIMNEAKVELISKELNEASYHIERNANPKIIALDLSLQIFIDFEKIVTDEFRENIYREETILLIYPNFV